MEKTNHDEPVNNGSFTSFQMVHTHTLLTRNNCVGFCDLLDSNIQDWHRDMEHPAVDSKTKNPENCHPPNMQIRTKKVTQRSERNQNVKQDYSPLKVHLSMMMFINVVTFF